MWRSLVFAGFPVVMIEAFTHATIMWAGIPGQKLVLAPSSLPSRSLIPNQKLTVASPVESLFSTTPYFTMKPDRTISWGATGWCIEAGGEKHENVVRLNRCSGEPDQTWSWIPSGNGQMMIQLSGTSKCLDVVDKIDSDSALVALRECGDQISEFWKLGEVGSHELSEMRSSRQQRRTLTPMLVLVIFVVLAALAAVNLHTRLWRCQGDARVVAERHGRASLNIDHGGVALSSSLSKYGHMQRTVHVAMAMDPADKDTRNADENANRAAVSSHVVTSAGARGLVSPLTGIVKKSSAGAAGTSNKNTQVAQHDSRPHSTSELFQGVGANSEMGSSTLLLTNPMSRSEPNLGPSKSSSTSSENTSSTLLLTNPMSCSEPNLEPSKSSSTSSENTSSTMFLTNPISRSEPNLGPSKSSSTSSENTLFMTESLDEWMRSASLPNQGLLLIRPQFHGPWLQNVQADVDDAANSRTSKWKGEKITLMVPNSDPQNRLQSLQASSDEILAKAGLPCAVTRQIRSDILSLGRAVGQMCSFASNLEVTLEIMGDNVCSRWHQDNYVARAIVTYNCHATEYTDGSNVDFWELEHCGNNQCIIRDVTQIQNVEVGDVLFIKGKLFPNSKGLVHKSPEPMYHEDGRVMNRLVLKVDVPS